MYTPSFVRQYKKLPKNLQEETKEKIDLFQSDPTHPFLKTHKLKGRLTGRYSFSVNYTYRIVFRYTKDKDAILLVIGDHQIYE